MAKKIVVEQEAEQELKVTRILTIEELKAGIYTDGVDFFEVDEISRGEFVLRETARSREIGRQALLSVQSEQEEIEAIEEEQAEAGE